MAEEPEVTKIEAQAEAAAKEVREVRVFVNDEGKDVTGFFEFDMPTLKLNLDTVLYKGTFPVMTNRGPIQMHCKFPVGYSLEKCFEEFDKFALEAVEEKKKETEAQNLIVTPNQAKKSGIIV